MVLIIGSKGSMGRRYAACLNWIDKPFKGVDIGDKWPTYEPVTNVIVATPTETHYKVIQDVKRIYNCPILVEKPISLDLEQAKSMRIWKDNVYIVNNWAHIFDYLYLQPLNNSIYYSYYNTGMHSTYEDCIQLVYLAKNTKSLKVSTENPVWKCEINGVPVTLEDVHRSYVRMINAFLHIDKDRLWTAEDAYKQLKILRKRYK